MNKTNRPASQNLGSIQQSTYHQWSGFIQSIEERTTEAFSFPYKKRNLHRELGFILREFKDANDKVLQIISACPQFSLFSQQS
jgi:hypothetical protein